ncbi:MAG: penicillin-binding protein 2 [Candidatus Omnitrophica bacterium]|nr:penicillin-binding protein 2 [Candidatus Omnitrophota bacterium]
MIHLTMSLCFVVLAAHLFKMQVLDHAHYLAQSESNRIRPVILEAPRGLIYDRRGEELVTNRLNFDCYIIPAEAGEYLRDALVMLSGILGTPEAELRQVYEKRKDRSDRAVLLAEDITKERAIRIEEEASRISGVFVKTRPVRDYLLGPSAAHVIGYIGAIGSDEYRQMRDYGYILRDWVGRDGVERSYDSYLRGRHGASQFESDSRGRLLRVLSIREREQGHAVTLTIDARLQKELYKLLDGHRGAAAVMELENGGLLALASAPSYDPNIFVRPAENRKRIREVLSDRKRPLSDRAIGAEYPPGSTFKIVTSTAALASGSISGGTQFFCTGVFYIGNFKFPCWKHSGHGIQDVRDALAHSCNVFFYQAGLKSGVERLSRMARKFGLGEATDIDLPYEKDGLVPDAGWKKRVMHEKWYTGETAHLAIGQGFLLATPLQMLRAAAVVATGGKVLRPYVVSRIDRVEISPRKSRHFSVDEGTLALVREGLARAVGSDSGTGQNARVEGLKICGKTGTAQVARQEDHAWFVGYAPERDPKAAVVVFLENGGHGGGDGARIAGELFRSMKAKGYLDE